MIFCDNIDYALSLSLSLSANSVPNLCNPCDVRLTFGVDMKEKEYIFEELFG